MGIVTKRLSRDTAKEYSRIARKPRFQFLHRGVTRKEVLEQWLPEVKDFIENLYRVRFKNDPSITFFKRVVTYSEDAEMEYLFMLRRNYPGLAERFSELRITDGSRSGSFSSIKNALFNSRFSLFYYINLFRSKIQEFVIKTDIYSVPIANINFPIHIFTPGNMRKSALTHECTHHLTTEQGLLTLLEAFAPFPSSTVARTCNEGLADFAGFQYLTENPVDIDTPNSRFKCAVSRLVIALRKYFDDLSLLIFYPIKTIKIEIARVIYKRKGLDYIIDHLEREPESKYSKFLMMPIGIYNSGFCFINKLNELGMSPQDIFSNVTTIQPTIREIFYPEQYMGRLKEIGAY